MDQTPVQKPYVCLQCKKQFDRLMWLAHEMTTGHETVPNPQFNEVEV